GDGGRAPSGCASSSGDLSGTSSNGAVRRPTCSRSRAIAARISSIRLSSFFGTAHRFAARADTPGLIRAARTKGRREKARELDREAEGEELAVAVLRLAQRPHEEAEPDDRAH